MSKRISNSSKRRKIEQNLVKATSFKDYAKVISDFKYRLNIQQWSTLFEKLDINKKTKVEGVPLPSNVENYRKINTYFSYNFLELEILWLTNILQDYHQEINKFLELKKSYETFLLLGKYTEARDILDLLDSNVCISNWSIEQRFFLAEHEFGFKKNKEHLSQLLDKDLDPLNIVLFRYQSIKAEKNISAYKYRKIIHDYTNKYDSPLLKEYLTFKLDFFAQKEYLGKGFLLSMENNASIIDRYESLILILSMILSEDNSGNIKNVDLIGTISCALKNIFEDKRLSNLSLICNRPAELSLDREDIEFVKAIDLYSVGDYQGVIAYIREIIHEYPYNIDLYKLYIKSIIVENIEFENCFVNECIANKILKAIYNVYSKNYEAINSLLDLHKYVVSTHATHWTSELNSFLINENLLYTHSYNHNLFKSIQSPYLNPQILFYTDQNRNLELFKEHSKIGDSLGSSTFKFIINCLKEEEAPMDISKFRVLLYKAKHYYHKGEIDKSLDLFNILSTDEEYNYFYLLAFNYERIIQGKAACLREKGAYREAVSTLVGACIQNENFTSRLYSEELVNYVKETRDFNIASDISIPIYLYLNREYGNPLWVAYDNFLVSHNLNYPHEIESKISEFDRDKLIFFLDRVCVKEVYDSSFFYENQYDLDMQRIEVCLLLTRIDKVNYNKYIEEISAIDRDILIRRGIQQIDESKIYADTRGIKNSLEKELRESFNRYIELATIPLEQISKIDSDIEDVFVFFLEKKLDRVVDVSPSEIKLTSYNRFAYFSEMFYKIRDQFISSNDHGLETYLSMRIRHGTLLGVIRSVFETRHLITKKDSNKGLYNPNSYWLDKLMFINNLDDQITFNDIMSKFSSSIDNISEELKNKWLQINIETKESEGLFDYNYHKETSLLQLFQEKIGKITNYDEFMDSIIEELWNKTEENLQNIRKFISESIRQDMIGKLSEMQEALECLKEKSPNLDFIEIIREIISCKTAISQELNTISEWFKRSNSKTINDFDIKLPIDACLVTLKRIESDYSTLSPCIKVSSHTRIDGIFLTHFTDIMHIIIGNIVKHSHLAERELEISIEVEESDHERLSILVENNVSKICKLDQINSNIENTKKLLNQKLSVDKTREEGGSGYLKLKKIMTSDLERDDYEITIYPVLDDYVFKTKIDFSIVGLEKI